MLESMTDWRPGSGPDASGVQLPPPPSFAIPPPGASVPVPVVVLAGVAAALAGAALWAVVDYASGYNTSIVSLVIGLLVGWAVRSTCGGPAPRPLAVTAGVLAVAGAALGQLLAVYALVAKQSHVSFLTAVRGLPAHYVWLDYRSSAGALTLLFFALAGWWGYRHALSGGRLRAGFGGGRWQGR
jgi:hypothetical protein